MDEKKEEFDSSKIQYTQQDLITSQKGTELSQQSNGKAVASLILGILGIVFVLSYILSPISVILGILGLILGISSNKKNRSGIAVAGIITSAISLGLGLLEICSCVALLYLISEAIKSDSSWLKDLENFNFAPLQQYLQNIQNSLTI